MSECNSTQRSSAKWNSIESDEESYYQRKKDVMLKREKDYDENDKKSLRD